MIASLLALLFTFVFFAPAGGAEVDAAAEEALAELPGDTAFAFTEITHDGPKLLYGINENDRMAVGSTFKLFILGRLIDEVNDGRRRLDDTMLLRADQEGPPASELADWPIGSPVTLNTLALKMISISDNTATDHLLYLLGRRNVERQMGLMGHGDPALNRPLLSTREMTMLRDKAAGMPAREYRELDDSAKRKFLARLSRGPADYASLDFDTAAYREAEWYASPMDMAEGLTWIYHNTGPKRPAALLRAILAVDPKLETQPGAWKFVGFKGGSEDQIMAGNWLLEHEGGKWYTLHVYWNSPEKEVSPEAMIEATQKILAAIEADLAPTAGSAGGE